MNTPQTSEAALFLSNLKNGIWFFGISSWVFGITDRTLATLADGYLSAIDIAQLFTASFFFMGWLFLKPARKI
ncbi:hypothetical protein H6G20_16035 [Desertifilum sp. FACHB-1129]|uniref:Uncharacterized protein n=2 Tax=Desertifilum tharense IPPAS B-1220 TaxID=1781255 RepID=A0A1E5QR63_9CYAN|nr:MULTISPECIES: hypothetical protein [Desertifilum]MDA0212123.1 hypothetical protein [Cyanobacteria bacterium FC1]MDI9638270.1 hypothetical protein [Geitlerinema splendidum]NES96689.1 hypothetical protein [Desertifilum sp. SIO1I2]MBD2313179.1 hypothetical protein [Desertifilum sp. FACHB-1129]MBD2323558.1 hypothetical protein [Desertifilum sp. FACHB-866]